MYKKKIEEIFKQLGHDVVCTIPKNPDFGDYTTNIALQLAKSEQDNGKQTPDQIAKKILKKLGKQEFLEKVSIVNGFINFFIKPQSLMQSLHNVCDYSSLVNPEVDIEGGENKKIVIEHTSPNTNKPLHVGHIRNNVLATSVIRLLQNTGNTVQPVEIINDRGIHIAKSMWGYLFQYVKKGESWQDKLVQWVKRPNLWSTPKKKGKRGDYFNGECYVYGEQKLKSDPDIAKELQQMLQAWENKEPDILKLWETMNNWWYEGSDITYQWLGSLPSDRWYENQIYEEGKKIVQAGLEKEIFKKGETKEIYADLSKFKLPNKVVLRPDETAIYITQDIALAKLRIDKYKADKYIWIVGGDQKLYFKQLFAILELLGEQKDKFFHLVYGMVYLPSGKMSSREGTTIFADDVFEIIKKQVAAVMKQSPTSKEIKDEEKEQIIDIVSIGAIKFAMLKYSPSTNITFDLQKSVSLQGDSGPYVQYTYARSKSVLRSAQYDYQPTEIKGPLEPEERELLRKIEHFDFIVEEAAANYAPNTLATYLLDFAKAFNLFYQKHPIIKAGAKQELRLALTCAVAVVLKQGLNILGIDSPERM